MATSRRNSSTSLTGAQAQYVLGRLVAERRISKRDVQQALSSMQGEISELEARLAALRDAAGRGGSRARPGAAAQADAPTARGGKRRRRHQNLTPQRRAELRLQGHYLALMAKIPKTKRPGFKAIFRSQGVAEAIKRMRKATGG